MKKLPHALNYGKFSKDQNALKCMLSYKHAAIFVFNSWNFS